MIKDKEIKQFIHAARCDNDASFDMIEKYSFSAFISSMEVKLLNRLVKGENEEISKQLASLQRMSNFLERMTFKNCVFHFQAKTILSQDKRIAILEQEKMDLIKRSTTKITSLSKELESVKKRIKNDKESS